MKRKLKTGEWIDESPLTDKKVMCYRCCTIYNLRAAPRVMSSKVEVKEPVCPECNCKVYFS